MSDIIKVTMVFVIGAIPGFVAGILFSGFISRGGGDSGVADALKLMFVLGPLGSLLGGALALVILSQISIRR